MRRRRRKSAVLGSAGLIGLPATPNSHAAIALALAVAAAVTTPKLFFPSLSFFPSFFVLAPPDRDPETVSPASPQSFGVSLSLPSKIFMEMNPIGHKF